MFRHEGKEDKGNCLKDNSPRSTRRARRKEKLKAIFLTGLQDFKEKMTEDGGRKTVKGFPQGRWEKLKAMTRLRFTYDAAGRMIGYKRILKKI